jgi:hypothetical protein
MNLAEQHYAADEYQRQQEFQRPWKQDREED